MPEPVLACGWKRAGIIRVGKRLTLPSAALSCSGGHCKKGVGLPCDCGFWGKRKGKEKRIEPLVALLFKNKNSTHSINWAAPQSGEGLLPDNRSQHCDQNVLRSCPRSPRCDCLVLAFIIRKTAHYHNVTSHQRGLVSCLLFSLKEGVRTLEQDSSDGGYRILYMAREVMLLRIISEVRNGPVWPHYGTEELLRELPRMIHLVFKKASDVQGWLRSSRENSTVRFPTSFPFRCVRLHPPVSDVSKTHYK